jgi:hypothetical protein
MKEVTGSRHAHEGPYEDAATSFVTHTLCGSDF